MGYYTAYNVEVCKADPKTHNMIPLPPLMTKNEFVPQEVIDFFNQDHIELEFDDINSFSGYSKWYDWEKELTELSKKFPDLMFIAEGDGEDSDDLWIAWFNNGTSLYRRKYITHDDYDPTEMTADPKTYDPNFPANP